jgi:hypothetical protein
MPAKKPTDLIVQHETKVQKRQREHATKVLTPKKDLSVKAPATLTGDVARQVWQETVKMYMALDARIVSVLDQGLLLDYCTACQQKAEIDDMRTTAMSNYLKHEAILQKVQMGKQEVEPRVLLKLINAVNKSVDEVIKIDARADNKRKLIHMLRQSLMLTPRSRGNFSPEEKKVELPSDMARIIEGNVLPSGDGHV